MNDKACNELFDKLVSIKDHLMNEREAVLEQYDSTPQKYNDRKVFELSAQIKILNQIIKDNN